MPSTGVIILIIIIVIAVLAGIGYAIYYFFFRNKEVPSPLPTTPPPPILTQISGSMSQITIGSDGSIWGIDLTINDNNIFQLVGSTWIPIPGYLIQIKAVMASNVYGCNQSSTAYHWNGDYWSPYPDPTRLKEISASIDGTILGIAPNSDIYQNIGGNDWVQIPGMLAQITVGSQTNIWGLDTSGNLYSYTNSNWNQVNNNNTITYKSIAATADGTLWVVDKDGNIGKYLRIDNTFTVIYPKTNIIQIDAQNSSKMIGVDANRNIYTS